MGGSAELSGLWSRRLSQEHRVVYEVGESEIRFLQARYHYGDALDLADEAPADTFITS